MRTAPVTIWTNQALAASGIVTSKTISLNQVLTYAVQLTWTGTPTGNFTLEGSCDEGFLNPDGSVSGVTNWTLITGTSQAAGGAAGTVLYNLADVGYTWFHVLYTPTSGTGTVTTAICTLKGF